MTVMSLNARHLHTRAWLRFVFTVHTVRSSASAHNYTHTRTRAHAKQKNKCRASRCDRSIADRLPRSANVCVCARASVRQRSANTRAHTHTCVRPRGQNERVPACNAPANRAGSTRNRATLNQVTPETRTLARPSCAPRASSRSQWLHECLIFIWPAGTHIIFFLLYT